MCRLLVHKTKCWYIMRPLISIIVPVYKVENYIDDCISSIVSQTYENIEIILVDDGSPDNCPKLCDEWKEKDSRIQVIHKQNGGLSDARNKALDIVKGDFISFVDSDDWIEKNMIETMYLALDKHNADICSCSIINHFIDENKISIRNCKEFVGNSEEALKHLYMNTDLPVASWCKLYKSYLWKDQRFPVGKVYEDAMTTYLIIDKAKAIVQINTPLYHYRIRKNSITNSKCSLKIMDENDAWENNYLFCKKNYKNVADLARSFWLEHLPKIISAFPKELSSELLKNKNLLKGKIINNLCFIIFKISFKKKILLLRSLLK